MPKLNAGDMIFRHSSIPVVSSPEGKGEGVFVPTTPLPKIQVNEGYIVQQKEAFEKGVPPPHVGGEGGLVELENGGTAQTIGSNGGRRAMGYAN